MKRLLVLAFLWCCALPCSAQTGARLQVPLFEADTSQGPELQPWGRAAEALCTTWYGRIVTILKSNDNERRLPPVVRIVFEKDMKGVAHVAGTTMHIAADWVKANPNDFGMVIHELTHLVQRYPNYRASWLVEGIADYVRAKYFEPQLKLPRIDFSKAKYTDFYKTTAAFLTWAETKYNPNLVRTLHAALRQNTYTDELFKTATGHDVASLWNEFAALNAVK